MSQKKWKFNIVDVIVIAILVAGIAFVGMQVFGGEAEPSITGTYRVTFFAEEVPAVVADYLQVGSKILSVGHTMSVRNGNAKVDCYIQGIELLSGE